jgi:hypothetical protein
MQIRVLWREITNERVELGRRGKLWNEELCKLNRSLFQIFRVILNLVNCKLKAIFILLSVLVPFFPPPPISTPRAFFSDKQRNRALMKGRQPGVGGNGGGGMGRMGEKRKRGSLYFSYALLPPIRLILPLLPVLAQRKCTAMLRFQIKRQKKTDPEHAPWAYAATA